MKLGIFKLPKLHIIAAISAVAVHGAIASLLFSSTPVAITQQTLNISFVAPSSQHSSAKTSHKHIVINHEQQNAIKTQNHSDENQQDQDHDKASAHNETTGRQDKDATAQNSAEADPIFDAQYLNNPTPIYPRLARSANIQGKVLLNVVVKADGNPTSVEVSRSSGSSLLDNAAIDAVKKWHFIPARKKGRAIEASVVVPIDFKII